MSGETRDQAHRVLPPIRVLPIPETRPPALPADLPLCEVAEVACRSSALAYIQDTLAFETMPRRSDARPAAQLPDPLGWIRGTAQALLEVMVGLRNPRHVVRACAPDVYVAVARRHASAVRRAQRPTATHAGHRPKRIHVTRVVLSRPDDGIVEASVVIAMAGRARAMALRAEATTGSWRITVLEIA